MKYGRLDIKLPDLTEQIAALKDQLEKALITQEKFDKEVQQLKKGLLNFIVATNGAYTAPVKNKGRKNRKLAQIREKAALQRIREYIETQRAKIKELATEESTPLPTELPPNNESKD